MYLCQAQVAEFSRTGEPNGQGLNKYLLELPSSKGLKFAEW